MKCNQTQLSNMKANLETKVVNLEDIDTLSRLFEIIESGSVIDFCKCNDDDSAISLDYMEFGECGFERKSDWMRFVNKLNNYNDTPIKRRIVGDSKKCDWGGGVTVHKEDIDYSGDGFKITFDKPHPLLLKTIGEQGVLAYVSTIRGKITWEWYYRTSELHAELGNYAGVCEVYINEIEILN